MKKDKKTPKHSWNHRIVTEMKPEVMGKDLDGNPKLISKAFRVFSITEVHYENGLPVMYGSDMNILKNWETLEDLKQTYKLVKSAFKKSVLDLNNWPKNWQSDGTVKYSKIHEELFVNPTIKNEKPSQ